MGGGLIGRIIVLVSKFGLLRVGLIILKGVFMLLKGLLKIILVIF